MTIFRLKKKAIAVLEHDLRSAGKETKMATIAAKLGLAEKLERPECDDRTYFWQETYWLAARGRPHTHGIPLPLPPLDIIELVEKLQLPAEPAEAVAVISGMDDAWIKWKDTKQSKAPPKRGS